MGNPTAVTQGLGLGKKGIPAGLAHVGHPGTGKKKVKASQTPSSIRMKSHWGQLDVMSSREKQLVSCRGGA